MGLDGHVALVTGAAGQGMGRSIAWTLAREGADIVVNYRSKREQAEAVAKEIEAMGRGAICVRADVSEPQAVSALVASARERFGRLDILINSAGGRWKPQDITQIPPVHFRAVMADEIEATFLLLRATLPGMREQGWGRVISIGGHMADDWRFGPPEAPLDYPLGKAARHWLTRTLAPREARHGITINAIAPGPTPHVSFEQALADVHGARDEGGPRPQDVAEIAAYLCSEAAARITGAIVPVPGERPV